MPPRTGAKLCGPQCEQRPNLVGARARVGDQSAAVRERLHREQAALDLETEQLTVRDRG